MIDTTYFLSGHLDLTADEFDQYYKPRIDDILEECDQQSWLAALFVVGDARGADAMCQQYLFEQQAKYVSAVLVTVYHMFTSPRNNAGFPVIGGFKSDSERDAAMTQASDVDIAWVRLGREKSGTQKNLDRRNAPN